MPHVIRLRGPWLYEVVEGDPGTHPRRGKVKMPTDWAETLGNDFRGRVRCTRHFGKPTGLHDRSLVMLVMEHAVTQVTLNGQQLTESSPRQFDVTDHLPPRNELCVDVTLPTDAMTCVVELEI